MKFKPGRELKEFNYLYREMEKSFHKAALSLGFSDSAYTILYSITELGDGCLQKDIAELNAMSRQTVNTSIKHLENAGYLTLQPGKGRDMHIFLTEKGQQLINEKLTPIFNIDNEIFEEMPPEEVQELLRLTRKYVTMVREKLKQLL